MPMTVAPTSASARTNCRWLGGKNGSTKTTFTPGMLVLRHAAGSERNCRVRSTRRYVRAWWSPRSSRRTCWRPPRGSSARRARCRVSGWRWSPASRRSGCPPSWREQLAGHWRVDDALDPRQIAEAVAGLAGQLGRVERLVGALEQLQVPLAQVREELGIEGMDVADRAQRPRQGADEDGAAGGRRAVRPAPAGPRARRGAGVRRRGRLPAGRQAAGRRRRAGDVPARRRRCAARLAGGAAAAPGRARRCSRSSWSATSTPSTACTWAARRCGRRSRTTGRRRSTVLRNPWIQWTVLLPRDIDGPEYAGIRPVGPAALRALGVTRRVHPHGVVPPPGRLGRGVGGRAPDRPARSSTSMLGYAHDVDLYGAWAELVDPRPLRAARAPVRRGHGLPARPGPRPGPRRARRRRACSGRSGTWSSRPGCPSRASPPSSDYEGEGYVIVRDPDTDVVERRAATQIVERRPRGARLEAQ